MWKIVALILSFPPLVRWLVQRSYRTPYWHIIKDGETYMERYWLFNPYDIETRKAKHPWIPFNIRVHIIHKPDEDAHLHDHPWNARTIILDGWYIEEEPDGNVNLRVDGDTATLGHRQYHRINHVSKRGVITLFITGRECGRWGYLVGGKHVDFRDYRKMQTTVNVEFDK